MIADPQSDELKDALKAALIEVLEERRDFLADAVAEALEEIGLAEAIREGRDTPLASREQIDQALGPAE